MLAPMVLCTAAVMATPCSRLLFIAGPAHFRLKRPRQHQHLPVMIPNHTTTSTNILLIIAPHHQRQRQWQPLLHHHRAATTSLSSAPPRVMTRVGGSKAAPVATAAAASAAVVFAGRGGANLLRCRGRGRQELLFSTSSSHQTEVNQPNAGGKKTQRPSPPPDLPTQQQEQQQQQPAGSTSGRSPSHAKSSSLAVLSTRGENNDSDDLERCRPLAQNLGVALLVDGERDWGGREGRGEGEEGGAGSETDGFRFTLSFDETGRLALGQPGSGFKPLAVDFSGGKTGHRAKNQKGTEQVVKAAALPKRRAGAAASAGGGGGGGGGGGVGVGGGGGIDGGGAAAVVSGRKTSSDVSWGSNGEGGRGGGLEEGCGDVEERLPLLWDLTAGLGTDSFVLALAGWRVEMFERSTVVAALVQDALDRARAGDDETARVAASRMSLVVADSTDACAERAAAQGWGGGGTAARRPAVVYLDPMFPQRKKSALVKKGMQMLQALLEEDGAKQQGRGDDGCCGGDGGGESGGDGGGVGGGDGGGSDGERELEEQRLFDAAMSVATRKVVVKRPVHGAAIVGHVAPSHAVVSKNGRFDVYVVK